MSETENGDQKKDERQGRLRSILWPESAAGRLLRRAADYSLLFGLVHILGFREYTSLLSGTGSFDVLPVVLGTAYLVLYICFVLGAPACVIAAALLKGADLIKPHRSRP